MDITADQDSVQENSPAPAPTLNEAPTKGRHRALRIAGWIIGALVAVVIIAVVAVNIFVHTAYSQFYENSEAAFSIPGLAQGFIPQDLDHINTNDAWLFSGYMGDGSASPIYKMMPDGSTQRLLVKLPDGSIYDGHGSGITSDAEHLFLTQESGLLVFDLAEVATASDGATVQALDERKLEFSPAFVNIEDDVMYLGNFYREGNYETPDHHRIPTPSGETNPAVMYGYLANDNAPYGYEEHAAMVYSIPERIQGMCELPSGNLVLSQSYGLATSHLLVFDPTNALADGAFTADGREVPLYTLDTSNRVAQLPAPPMTEGIEYENGRIYIAEESASNKYIFGKLYGAGLVYALKV